MTDRIQPDTAYTRRSFLTNGMVLASAAMTVPAFVNRSALGMPMAAPGLSSIPGVPEDHVLVVVQLAGGNDGLNAVVPYRDDAYYSARPTIGIRRDQVLELGRGDDIGLHPQLGGLKSLYDDGLMSVIQGVGYPNPNRSHFKSMDIWHTADTSGTGTGWLGRFFDNECCGTDESGNKEPDSMAGIAIGREAPLAMQGLDTKPIGFENTDLFRWTGADVHDALDQPYEAITRHGVVDGTDQGSNAAFLMRTALDAQVSSDEIRRAVARRPMVEYPRNQLAQQLSMVASMIQAGLRTRVYYVTLGGFDTHSGQGGANGRHANLMGQLSGSVRAFYNDLQKQGNDGRVLTMSFSEFGRRVHQNASGGTDHGAAAPMFLFGPMVRPGVIGRHPSLTDLDNGDLKHTTDFREIYTGILDDWFKADAETILEGRFRAAKVLKTT